MDNISLRDWFAGQALIAIADDCGMTDEEVAERCYQRADALLAKSKKREPDAVPAVATETKPRPMALPDDDGWIKWEANGRPVAREARVDIRNRAGRIFVGEVAGDLRWSQTGQPHDIVAYRVSEAGAPK